MPFFWISGLDRASKQTTQRIDKMEYDNFWDAYLAQDKQAKAIGDALEKAMDSLVKQGLVPDSTYMWRDMCNQAWAKHVEKYYFGF